MIIRPTPWWLVSAAGFTPFTQDVTPPYEEASLWSQSVTIPAGAVTVDIIVIAQGGKGGDSSSSDSVGGSGGGGGASSQETGISLSGASTLYLYIDPFGSNIAGVKLNNSSGTILCAAACGSYGQQNGGFTVPGGSSGLGVGTVRYSGGTGAAGSGISSYFAGGGGAASLIADGGNAPAASSAGTGGTSTAPGGNGGTKSNGNAYGGGGAGRSKGESTSVRRDGGGALFRLSWS